MIWSLLLHIFPECMLLMVQELCVQLVQKKYILIYSAELESFIVIFHVYVLNIIS